MKRHITSFLLIAIAAAIFPLKSYSADCSRWLPKSDPDSLSFNGRELPIRALVRTPADETGWFEHYKGHFEAHLTNFRWNEEQLKYLRDSVLDPNDTLVYEFRRGGENGKTPSGDDVEHWDGLWGKAHQECASGVGFVIGYALCGLSCGVELERACVLKYNVLEDHSFYWTNLPEANNRGAEEADSWFDKEFSSRYDLCRVVEPLEGILKKRPNNCDEEYEIHADPSLLEAGKAYSAYISFKLDDTDGSDPTPWTASFAAGKNSYLSQDHDSCLKESGVWKIDYSNLNDFDNDGMDNNWERMWSLNPNIDDSTGDPDGDGLSNINEYHSGASPQLGDSDGDGYSDKLEWDQGTDPMRRTLAPADYDLDGIPDSIDTDDDNDGYPDVLELEYHSAPLNAASFPLDYDRDFIPDTADTDDDNDGHFDAQDALPFDFGEWQDTDNDGIGNNRDNDDDGDGAGDATDAFPLDGAEWVDTDGDGAGNNRDLDDDGDGIADATDAFPLDRAEWLDTDGDRIGNNRDIDDDNDRWIDAADAFPLDSSEHTDTDRDGTGNNADNDDDGDSVFDAVDLFPLDPSEWADNDYDGIGDNLDRDDDNDGVLDPSDIFPLDALESADNDEDGLGDNADFDDDNDVYPDSLEEAVGSDPLDDFSQPAFPPIDMDGDDVTDFLAYMSAPPLIGEGQGEDPADDASRLFLLTTADGGRSHESSLIIELDGPAAGWIFIPADYDGDGNTEIAAYRREDGCTLYVIDDTGAGFALTEWYECADELRNFVLTPIDLDGDGQDDLFAYQLRNENSLHAFISEGNAFEFQPWPARPDIGYEPRQDAESAETLRADMNSNDAEGSNWIIY